MASIIRKRSCSALTAADPQTISPSGGLGLGCKFGKLLEIRVKSWASSAKAAGGTDTTQRLKITDNAGSVVFLDVADRNYANGNTVVNVIRPTQDAATPTGITPVVKDSTGVPLTTAGATGMPIVMESPVTVVITGGNTATDFVSVDLLVEG